SDWYSPTAYEGLFVRAPKGPMAGSQKVVRGGSYLSIPYNLHLTRRSKLNPARGYQDVGFRCAK
ncbi:MAG: SUMF1/EgtB/PvdO family nonheme iron enzyme, partial [Bacteroidota bacterium]